MKKAVIISSILFSFFAIFGIVHAGTTNINKWFGGKITNIENKQIKNAEGAGFKCDKPGKTLSIELPSGFFAIDHVGFVIPSSVKSKTKNTPAIGQWIMGFYSGKTAITCTREGNPPEKKTVNLDTVTMFGTSK